MFHRGRCVYWFANLRVLHVHGSRGRLWGIKSARSTVEIGVRRIRVQRIWEWGVSSHRVCWFRISQWFLLHFRSFVNVGRTSNVFLYHRWKYFIKMLCSRDNRFELQLLHARTHTSLWWADCSFNRSSVSPSRWFRLLQSINFSQWKHKLRCLFCKYFTYSVST